MTSTTQANSTPKVAVNDIGSEEAFLAAIDETIKYFNDGDIVEGTVVKVDRDEVLLDIGYKTEGVIPSRELSIKHDVDPHDVVKTGEHIEALVLQKEDKEGRLILSKKRAQYERAWGTIEKIKEEDGVVTGTVIEVVKGGLILDIGLRGFLPASLVEMRRVRDLQPYVGKEIEAKIIELDKNRNNVVLSRRAWLEQTQSEVRHTFLNTLQKGQIRKGQVSSIVNFGAFVDLGGVDGLVHVSELSWKHIDHPGEVVEVGQEVTVEVLDVDMDRERVSLSLKSTQEDPWQQFARTHQIGQVVPGRVTKLVPFGAFVRVEEGIEGLVHISELADRHVEIPEQVVQVGDEIFVKIIDIDLDRRRISLSLKQANEGTIGEAVGDDFDPTLYGMPASYDEQGNYEYPEGFDPETGEWLPGYEKQREEWEHQYAEARARFEAHRRQVEESRKAADEEEATAAISGEAGDTNGAARARALPGVRAEPARPGPGRGPARARRARSPQARPRGPRPPAPWPRTRPWPLSARSFPAARANPDQYQKRHPPRVGAVFASPNNLRAVASVPEPEPFCTPRTPGGGLMKIESPDQQGLDDFTALYVRHYEQLLRLAVLLVGDLAAAEDVVSEAFIRVHHALKRRQVNSPLAYLRQSVVNLARSELRLRLIRLRHAPGPMPNAASAEEGACAALSRQEVIRALRRIPARQREAVVLRYWADLPEAEIAELMGVTVGAVKSYISRGTAKLGLLLEGVS